MKTKYANLELTTLQQENIELKKALETKVIEVEAFEFMIKLIGKHYNVDVKRKFRTQAIYQMHKAKNYNVQLLCDCFGCKRDTYYKAIHHLNITDSNDNDDS